MVLLVKKPESIATVTGEAEPFTGMIDQHHIEGSIPRSRMIAKAL